MSEPPYVTIAIALIDAVIAGPPLESGGIDRRTVQRAETLGGITPNHALLRYRQDHPHTVLDDELELVAIEQGRSLYAVEGVEWLVENGYLRAVGKYGLALGKPYEISSRSGTTEFYVPGKAWEQTHYTNIQRRITPARLDLIRESLARVGDLKKYFPVLRDEDDQVVDGRHRLAIDPNWPSAEQRVPRDQRLLALMAANRTNSWEAEDWERLKREAEAVYGKRKAQRELVRLQLLENHQRSDRAIAGLVGCSHPTVGKVRDDLERDTGKDYQYLGSQGGKPRSDGTPAQPREPAPPAELAPQDGPASAAKAPDRTRRKGKPSIKDDPQVNALVREAKVAGTYGRKFTSELAKRFGTSHGVIEEVGAYQQGLLDAEVAQNSEPATPDANPHSGLAVDPRFVERQVAAAKQSANKSYDEWARHPEALRAWVDQVNLRAHADGIEITIDGGDRHGPAATLNEG